MLEFLRRQLDKLLEQRKALAAERDKIVADAEARGATDLTDAESAAFDEKRQAVTDLDAKITAKRAEIKEAEEDEKREQAAASAYAAAGQTGERRSGGAVVTREPTTYGQNARHSYFLDLARAELGRGDGDGGVAAARERLSRHARELDVELPAREARREEAARRALDGIEGRAGQALTAEERASVFERGGMEHRVNPNRTDGQGGYFVPPLWLVDQYIELARFGRQTANLCRTMPLPSGTDSINLPKVSTGTATGVQTADAGSVTSTDLTDTSVSASVRTIAGQQDVALQLLDQSPIAFDRVVFDDLIADYNMRLDIQVINGSGSSGQHLGILNVSGINAITYTDASPTLPEMYPSFAQAASQIYKNRKLPATAAVVFPSVWYWATGQLDTTNRPLIVPPQVGWNPAGTQQNLATGEGPAGMLSMGLPGFLDGNIPTNLGGGTNETRTIAARFPDIYLWEGALQTRALQEVLSGTLQVRFQVYAYSAFMANRRPESISVISGTGMIPQSGY